MSLSNHANEQADRTKPLYAQIAEEFGRRIQSGQLNPGDRLPSQTELMAEFAVSQATVRQALLNLSNQGLVVARQGKGVFVAEARVSVDLSQTRLDLGTGSGSLRYELMATDLLAAPDRMADLLEIEPGANIIRARRRLLSDGRKIGLETCNLPLDVMQSIPHEALSQQDLHSLLNQSPQWRAEQGAFWVSAGPVTAFDAELLDVPGETVVLQREDVTRDKTGRPILMTRAVFLAELVSLSGTSQMGRRTA